MESIQVKKLDEDAIIPKKNHFDDAAYDLYALKETLVPSGERVTIKTGISISFPSGVVALIKDRSGLAAKFGLTTMAGVIDSGYRGEYLILMFNTSSEDYLIKKGERAAQVLFVKLSELELVESKELPDALRGEKGFGSSGKF